MQGVERLPKPCNARYRVPRMWPFERVSQVGYIFRFGVVKHWRIAVSFQSLRGRLIV